MKFVGQGTKEWSLRPVHTIEQCEAGSAHLPSKAHVLWYTHRVVGGSHSQVLVVSKW